MRPSPSGTLASSISSAGSSSSSSMVPIALVVASPAPRGRSNRMTKVSSCSSRRSSRIGTSNFPDRAPARIVRVPLSPRVVGPVRRGAVGGRPAHAYRALAGAGEVDREDHLPGVFPGVGVLGLHFQAAAPGGAGRGAAPPPPPPPPPPLPSLASMVMVAGSTGRSRSLEPATAPRTPAPHRPRRSGEGRGAFGASPWESSGWASSAERCSRPSPSVMARPADSTDRVTVVVRCPGPTSREPGGHVHRTGLADSR